MSKQNADDTVVMPLDHLGNLPIAWIIESNGPHVAAPFLTHKPAVAMKRYKAGDFVTPYHTQRELPQEDEL